MIMRVPTVASVLAAALLIGQSATASAQAPSRPRAAPAQAAPAAAAPAKPAVPTPTAASGEARSGAPADGGEIIARVGTSDVTVAEMRAAIATLDQRQQSMLARDPALLAQTVRVLLATRLVLKEAVAKKWDQQPNVVAQLDRARQNLIAETYLQSMTAPPEDFPGEAEIKAVYEANASAFLVPRRFHVAQIFIAVAKDADKAAEEGARRKVDELAKKLKQPGADFAALAKTESDDKESTERGGELGWLAEAEMRPEIRTQVVGLAQSATTDPVRLDDGWHVLKLLETEAAHTRPLGEVRDALVQRIRAERIEANRRAYMADLLKKDPPAINELAISKLLEPAAPR